MGLDRLPSAFPQDVVLTIPGVTGVPGHKPGLTGMSINGTPAASERIRIDGLDATYTLGNAYYSFGAPSVDLASRRSRYKASNFAAEYGQSTGAVLKLHDAIGHEPIPWISYTIT